MKDLTERVLETASDWRMRISLGISVEVKIGSETIYALHPSDRVVLAQDPESLRTVEKYLSRSLGHIRKALEICEPTK